MSSGQFIAALAAAVSVSAAVSDARQRRIPNALTYPAMAGGLVVQGVLFGWRGLLLSVAGGVVFGGVFLLFYLVHAMGAGDVKLAAALGCIVGLPQAVSVMIDTAFAGGILAILLMLASRRTMQTIRNTLSVVGFHARHGLQAHPVVNLDNPDSARMPYGLAFAAGTLYWALFLQLWR
ncbi:MAG: A24 family peptidase [Acidobacteriia bacterium]|nr:A24 family peptidase [Terriglobia bacterium]